MKQSQTYNKKLLIRLLLILSIFLLSNCTNGIIGSPFLDRHGQHLSVKINGLAPTPISPLEVKDSNGNRDDTVHWEISTSGKLCIEVEAKHPDLMPFKVARIVLKEIRQDRPMQNWRNFTPIPNTSDDKDKPFFIPGKKYCPDEFILTPRLRFKTLPSGRYVLIVQYYGQNQWDAMHILMEIA